MHATSARSPASSKPESTEPRLAAASRARRPSSSVDLAVATRIPQPARNEAPRAVHDVLRSPGRPLDADTRSTMERRLGTDLSHVRVHTDERAAASARAVNALAYTVGKSIVFGRGRYAPTDAEGRRLLAHELVHTVQQNRGGSGSIGDRLMVGSPDTGAEQEADAIAAAVSMPASAAGRPAPIRLQTVSGAARHVLQRAVEPAGVPGGRPDLDVGASGPAVQLLQRLLDIAVTGRFDEPTRRAVVSFQERELGPGQGSGGVGPKTWQKLDDGISNRGAQEGKPGDRPNLDVGDYGPGVARLQRLLGIRPSAFFDESTRRAVVAFQERALGPGQGSGGVGPQTWGKLDELARPVAATATPVARPVGTPSGNVAIMLLEDPENARYRLKLNAWHESPSDLVGHAWISVEELDPPLRRFSFGFWPSPFRGMKGMVFGAKGTLLSPDVHDGQEQSSRVAQGTRTQIGALQGVVASWEGRDFELFGNNCARFAIDAWQTMTGDPSNMADFFFSSPWDVAAPKPPLNPFISGGGY